MEVGGGGEGERKIICLSLHCHHQNDFCIKVGSDESHFNASLIVTDNIGHKTESIHRPQYFKRKASRSGFEPWSLRLPCQAITPYRSAKPVHYARLTNRLFYNVMNKLPCSHPSHMFSQAGTVLVSASRHCLTRCSGLTWTTRAYSALGSNCDITFYDDDLGSLV